MPERYVSQDQRDLGQRPPCPRIWFQVKQAFSLELRLPLSLLFPFPQLEAWLETQQKITRVIVRMEGKVQWYLEGNDFVSSGQAVDRRD